MLIPKLKAPIVLVHGLMGYDRIRLGRWTVSEYFRGIGDALEAAGNRVLVPRMSRTAGVAQRAAQLKRFIDANAPGDAVHILAHSMGGLDSRYMVSHLGMASRVLSLTTIGTPHQGTTYADWMLRRFEAVTKPLFQVLNIPYQAFLDLSSSACREFNERTPNMPGVRCFGVAGRCDRALVAIPWLISHGIVSRAEGPNDGVVSVQSARFGEQTDVWEGDHLNLINVPNLRARLRGRWTDRRLLYGGLVRRLADCGF